VYEEQPVTTYRLQYETVMRPREVTSYRPVWTTEVRERRYRVAKPVMETSERQETYTVLRPIMETSFREQSYDRVRYVSETSTREQRIVVNKPVWQTITQNRQRTVRRPVTETVMQTQNFTQYQPVTTYETRRVDQGGYVDQVSQIPGVSRNRLRWLSGYCAVDPASGVSRYYRGGLHWVPEQTAPVTTTRRVYVPNVVDVQVPRTQMVAKVVAQQTPVQVTRYVDEVVNEPFQVQVCRMTQEVQVKQIPCTVQRPVRERVTYRIPVKTCRYERQEMVRKIPVTTCKWVYEDRVEEQQVRVCKMVCEKRVVQDPVTVCKWAPHTTMRRVARTVVMRMPLDDCAPADLNAATAAQLYPGVKPTITALPIREPAAAAEPTPAEDGQQSVLDNGDATPESEKPEVGPEAPPLPDDLDADAPSDTDETGTPHLKVPADPIILNSPVGDAGA